MGEAPDHKDLLTALTTEHFTLQGARSQTVSESSSRAALYIGSVSSAVVALGFLGQVSDVGEVFEVFALTVLPTIYLLGVFTFVRLVENSAEDFRYGLAINRIRGYYKQVAGDQAELFLLSGHDDRRGVLANMGVPFEGRQQYFTIASAIAVINSVVAGSAAAIAAGAFAQAGSRHACSRTARVERQRIAGKGIGWEHAPRSSRMSTGRVRLKRARLPLSVG
jgi:hypothetical protein